MAEKRMLSKMIVDSDAFLDLPLTSQALYFHLVVRADDEGFINNSKKIKRIINANEDDFNNLINSNFIIVFESGVIVIKHWKIHNNITPARKKMTTYQEERSQLTEKENGVYTLKNKSTIYNRENTQVVENSEDDESTENQNIENVENENTQVVENLEIQKANNDNRDDYFMLLENTTIMNYAKEIFNLFEQNELPCWNGNFTAFYMSDFKQSISNIKLLRIDFETVIKAIKNYIEVVQLARNGQSWFTSELSLQSLCKNSGLRKFLPDEFRIENFYMDKSKFSKNEIIPDDRINL